MPRSAVGAGLQPAATALVLAFCSAFANGGLRAQARPGMRAAGTYQLSIYNGTCNDSSGAAVRGYLVLDDRPLPLSAVPRPALEYFNKRAILLMSYEGWEEPLNACLVLNRDDSFQGYAGLTPVGLTRWSRQKADSVAVLIDQSPDAGYFSHFVIRDRRINGRGWAFGAGDAAVSLPDDVVRGQRIGPPDFGRCYAAAEAEARKPLRDPGSPFPP